MRPEGRIGALDVAHGRRVDTGIHHLAQSHVRRPVEEVDHPLGHQRRGCHAEAADELLALARLLLALLRRLGSGVAVSDPLAVRSLAAGARAVARAGALGFVALAADRAVASHGGAPGVTDGVTAKASLASR